MTETMDLGGAMMAPIDSGLVARLLQVQERDREFRIEQAIASDFHGDVTVDLSLGTNDSADRGGDDRFDLADLISIADQLGMLDAMLKRAA